MILCQLCIYRYCNILYACFLTIQYYAQVNAYYSWIRIGVRNSSELRRKVSKSTVTHSSVSVSARWPDVPLARRYPSLRPSGASVL